MKIAQILVGEISIPPKGWGAIEEIIWNYKIQLEQMGHTVDILMPGEDFSSYDIVHVHTANQAHMMQAANVNYVFTAHDIHPLLKDNENSDLFKSHIEAINNSLATIVPGKFAGEGVKRTPAYETPLSKHDL